MTSCNNNRVGSVYNKATNSKVHRGKLGTVPKATQVDPGLMTKEDFCKLEALIVPPPSISLTSNNCGTVITGGIISFVAGDNYIKVDSFVNIKQNEDGTASPTYSLVPIKIHDNTYGIRFSLDINRLSFFLARNNRLRIKGATGEQGIVGEQGIKGDDYILSGPRGRKGPTGSTPPIENTLQIEDIDTVQVGATGITNIQPRINTDGTYDLIVTRQPVGNPNVSTNKIALAPGSSSWWAVVVANPGTARTPYYLDMEGIVNSIHTRATSYADIIKTGYEDAVKFWIQTMSDLFDCQKSALCCAIERCESRKKSNELRQHWESTAAAAKPDYAATIRPREDASETGPSTGVLEQLYDDLDCGGSNSDCGDFIPPTTPPPPPPPPDDDFEPPGGDCWVNFNGGFLVDRSLAESFNGSEAFEMSDVADTTGYGEVVGRGVVDNLSRVLPKAVKSTFDSMVIGPDVSILITTQSNRVILDTVGPKIIINSLWRENNQFNKFVDEMRSRTLTGTNSSGVSWGEIFSPSDVFWSHEIATSEINNMHNWSDGVISIRCLNTQQLETQSLESVSPHLISLKDNPALRLALNDETVDVEARFNIAYPTKAKKVTLDKGVYEFTIISTDSNINNSYRGDVTILHKIGMSTKMASFLDKGSYESAEDSRSAYVGEVLTLEHNGGPVKLYYNAVNSSKVINSGSTQIQIHRIS